MFDGTEREGGPVLPVQAKLSEFLNTSDDELKEKAKGNSTSVKTERE